jgi:hypothetical protein
LFLKLPGVSEPQLLQAQWSDFPGNIKKAIINEFKALEGAKADQIELKLEGSKEVLKPMHTLANAGLPYGTGGPIKLVVQRTDSAMTVIGISRR